MGCFLGCFGFSKKKKRRKGGRKNVSGVQSYGSYVPLDSDAIIKLDNDEMQDASATELGDKPKESSTAKMKKKVSFNLNVKTYEPIPNDETSSCLSEDEKKTMWVYDDEETAGASMKFLNYEDNLMSSELGSFPANYRYQNCRKSYDEEDDEIELDESDSEDDELYFDEEDFGESYDFDHKISQGKVSLHNSALMETDEKVRTAQLQPLPQEELSKTESNQNARKRSQYAFSVLNPVENLSQWKEVKAKTRQELKLQKENIMLDQEQHILPSHTKKSSYPQPLNSSLHLNHFKPSNGIAVDSSLSNWLVSSETQRSSRWMHQAHSVDKIDQF